MLDKVMLNNNFVDYLGQSIEEYQVDKLLVRHAQSARYLAHTSSNKPVFIEILNSSSEQNPELDGRFHQQMHTLMQHPHPGIAAILHVGHTAKNHAYAVSQYIAGATLASKLEEWRDADTNLPVLGALHLIKHLAQTLAVVHPLDIFHHDLRPDNIILNKNNILVLIDLGVPYQDKPQQPIKQMNRESQSTAVTIYIPWALFYTNFWLDTGQKSPFPPRVPLKKQRSPRQSILRKFDPD